MIEHDRKKSQVQRRQDDELASTSHDPRAPGKRTRTMRLPPRATGTARPVQRSPDRAAHADRQAQAAHTESWLDTVMRPDLYPPPAPSSGQPPVQREAAGEAVSQATPMPASGSGRPMPEAVQAKMEHALGADFSAVRIHEGPRASALGARAYTQGTDIHFAPGQYDPGSRRGQELMGHELTHVVQQSQGRARVPTQVQGMAINDDAALENEADVLGARAARGASSAPAAARSPAAPAIQRKPSGAAPVQMAGGETLLAVAASMIGQTFASGAAAAAAIAAYVGVSTTTVYLTVSTGGLGIAAIAALLLEYRSGEKQEDPDLAALQEPQQAILTLLAGPLPYTSIVGKLTTREWYKAFSMTWPRKEKLLALVANQVADAGQRGLLAQVAHALAEHEGQDGGALLGTLGLALPPAPDPEDSAGGVQDEVDGAPAAVKNQLAQLRKNMSKSKRLKMFGQLDRIEQRISAWFHRYKSQTDHPARQSMFGYLDQVQELHLELTEHQIDSGQELWLPDNLEHGEDRGKIQAIWQAIVAGDAQITFDQEMDQSFGRGVAIPPEVTRAVKVEVISELGRLMSRPQGRKLIAIFFESDETGVVNFKLAQLYRMVVDEYVGDSAVARNDGQMSLSSSFHVATGKRRRKGKEIEKGRGQKSDVQVTPGKPDSLFLDYDADYNRILSPGYIGLGHELIHAAHNLRGVALGDWTLEGMPPEYHDLEEFVTIAPRSVVDGYRDNKVTGNAYQRDGRTVAKELTFGTLLSHLQGMPSEADLRAEHGLDARHEHISGFSDHTTGNRLPVMGEVSDVVKRQLPLALQNLTI